MAKHTINGCIAYRTKDYWSADERFVFYGFVPSEDDMDCIVVKEHSITFDVPNDFDPRPQQVKALEAEREKVRAEMSARITEINGRIQSLLAIEQS